MVRAHRRADGTNRRLSYKNMRLGVVALVFRCRPAGGALTENSEAAGFRWIQESEASAIMPEAFAIRILDAYRNDAEPSIRDHDGVKLIAPTS